MHNFSRFIVHHLPQGLMPESLLSNDRWRASPPRPLGAWPYGGLDGRGLAPMTEGGYWLVGVPAKLMAREKRPDIVEAGLASWFWGVDAVDPALDMGGPMDDVGVAAMSCSILLKIGSLLISAVLCIQVPVLMSSSCFFLQRMQTQII